MITLAIFPFYHAQQACFKFGASSIPHYHKSSLALQGLTLLLALGCLMQNTALISLTLNLSI
jgi:hypothetical protein